MMSPEQPRLHSLTNYSYLYSSLHSYYLIMNDENRRTNIPMAPFPSCDFSPPTLLLALTSAPAVTSTITISREELANMRAVCPFEGAIIINRGEVMMSIKATIMDRHWYTALLLIHTIYTRLRQQLQSRTIPTPLTLHDMHGWTDCHTTLTPNFHVKKSRYDTDHTIYDEFMNV